MAYRLTEYQPAFYFVTDFHISECVTQSGFTSIQQENSCMTQLLDITYVKQGIYAYTHHNANIATCNNIAGYTFVNI